MKPLLALAVSILLFASNFATGLAVAGAAHAADGHVAMDHAAHHGTSAPDGAAASSEATLCQIHCAAAAEVSAVHAQAFRLRWHWDGFRMGHGTRARGAAPEVAERPPRPVFV